METDTSRCTKLAPVLCVLFVVVLARTAIAADLKAGEGDRIDAGFDAAFAIGIGVDTTRNRARGECISWDRNAWAAAGRMTNPQGVGGRTEGITENLELVVVDDFSSLRRALGVSAHLSVNTGLWGGSAKGETLNSIEMNQYSVYGVFRSTVTREYLSLPPEIQLKDEVKTILKEDPDRFQELCGDHYISGVLQGGEYWTILDIKTSSQAESRAISGQLSARWKAVKADGKADKSTQRVLSGKRAAVTTYRAGGGGPLPDTVHDALAGVLGFRESVFSAQEPEKVVPISFWLSSYDWLLAEPYHYIDEDVREQLDVLVRLLDQASYLISNISYVLTNRGEFAEFDVERRHADMHKLERFRLSVWSAAARCHEGLPGCAAPEAPAFAAIRQNLPERQLRLSEKSQRLRDALGRDFDRRTHYWRSAGWTDLHFAALFDLPDLARHLLYESFDEAQGGQEDQRMRGFVNHGAGIRFFDERPQLLAVIEGLVDPRELDRSDLAGQTALHIAARRNSYRVVEVIVDWAARHCPDHDCLRQCDNDRDTPLDAATDERAERVASILATGGDGDCGG